MDPLGMYKSTVMVIIAWNSIKDLAALGATKRNKGRLNQSTTVDGRNPAPVDR